MESRDLGQKPGKLKSACLTCYGQGETANEWGLAACPDCGGAGALPPRDVLTEWRLRAIEKAYLSSETEPARDVAWLAFELRRSRDALVQILALSQEGLEPDATAKRIRYLANDALGVYEPIEQTRD